MILIFQFLLLAFSATLKFTVLSDTHYDVQFNPKSGGGDFCRGPDVASVPGIPYSYPGCDASPLLTDSYLRKVAEINPNPDFVLVLGDLPAHDHPETQAWEAMAGMTTAIRTLFPSAPVFPTLGNNDVFPDYCLYPSTPDYRRLRELYGSAFPPGEEVARTWDLGAYYAADIPGTSIRVVSLNTIQWSPKIGRPSYGPCTARPMADDAEDDPAGQAAWFEETIAQAARDGVSVWVIGHIPPGIDPYNGKMQYTESALRIWNARYAPLFDRADVIQAAFMGHRHKDQVQTLGSLAEGLGTPSFIVPSISPCNFNSPGVRSWTALQHPDGRWLVSDYEQWYADVWRANAVGDIVWEKDYSFAAAYPDYVHRITVGGKSLPVIDAETTKALSNVLLGSELGMHDLADAIMGRTDLHYNSERVKYACSIRAFTSENEFEQRCMRPQPEGRMVSKPE